MIEGLIYLAAITVAEFVTVFFQPLWGVVVHTVILAALITQSSLSGEQLKRQLFLSLALVPLVRVISLSMPLSDLPQILWYPIIYAPLMAATVVAMRVLNYGARDVGLTFSKLPLQLVVAVTGVGLGIAEFFILRPEAMVPELTWQAAWLPAIILLVSTGFVEEFIFRGVLQRTALASFGGWGIVYVSLIFAVLHMGFLSWIDVAFVFIVALFFGWVVRKTGSLLGVSLAHGITNVMLFIIVPLLLQ